MFQNAKKSAKWTSDGSSGHVILNEVKNLILLNCNILKKSRRLLHCVRNDRPRLAVSVPMLCPDEPSGFHFYIIRQVFHCLSQNAEMWISLVLVYPLPMTEESLLVVVWIVFTLADYQTYPSFFLL